MMKTLFTVIAILFFFSPVHASDKAHDLGAHAGMKGKHDHENMVPSKLGKYKKSKFKSKKKHFLIHAPLVPLSNGWGQFEITITDLEGKAMNNAMIGHATFEMPGMKMDLPPVKVTHLGKNKFKLGLPIQMAGMWKIKLPLTDGKIKDTAYIKFVSQ